MSGFEGFGGGAMPMGGGGMPGMDMGGGMPGMPMQNGMKELLLKRQQQQMMQQRQRFAELDKIRANAWKTMSNVHDQFVGSGKMSSQQFWNQPWAQTYMGAVRDVTKGMGLPDDVDGRIAGMSQKFAAGPVPGTDAYFAEHPEMATGKGPNYAAPWDDPSVRPPAGGQAGPSGPGNKQTGMPVPGTDSYYAQHPELGSGDGPDYAAPWREGPQGGQAGPTGPGNVAAGPVPGTDAYYAQHPEMATGKGPNYAAPWDDPSVRPPAGGQAGPSGPGKVPVPQFAPQKQGAVTGGESLPQKDAAAIAPKSGFKLATANPNGSPFPSVENDPAGKMPTAFIMHHTGGRGDPAGVVNDWRKHRPGIGTQFIMDRQGNIHDVRQELNYRGTGNIITGSGKGKGLNNSNIVGMEVIAKNNKDVTPEQIASAISFIQSRYPNTQVFGHGEVNPGHREADEGMAIVSQIRAMREGKAPQIQTAQADTQKGPVPGTDAYYAQHPEKGTGKGPDYAAPWRDKTQPPSLGRRSGLGSPALQTIGAGRNAITMPEGGGLFQRVHSAPRYKNPQMDDPWYGVGGKADQFKWRPGLSGTPQAPSGGATMTGGPSHHNQVPIDPNAQPPAAQTAPQPPQAPAAPASAPIAQSSYVKSGELPPLPENQLKVFGNEKDEVFRTMTPDQFDFMALQYAKGNNQALPRTGRNKAIALLDQMLIARATDYWKAKGLSAEDANNAILEFQAKKAGTRKIAQMQAQTIVALDKAENSAPVVIERSKEVPRTEYPLINSILMAAKEQTGDTKVIRFGQAMETLISNYASALANGNSVITDHMRKKAESILQKSWSEGQVEEGVKQLLVEIDREKKGTMQAMPDYLNQGKKEETKDPSKMSDDELKKALGIQ